MSILKIKSGNEWVDIPTLVGSTPNLTIGTVTTGVQAAATITGTAANPILNLILPSGGGEGSPTLDNTYESPEKFGAVGDGVVDDTQALANCLAYAATNNRAVRGYGTYKTTSTIIINWKYADVHLSRVVYTGNNFAVDLQHSNIRFSFEKITSSGAGIHFGQKPNTGAYAYYCQISGTEINSTEDCVVAQMMTLYNTCDIRLLYSTNGNCITFSDTGGDFLASEFVFRSAACHCPNGYVAYKINNSKMYDFTIEGDCKYGLFNPHGCMCYGFRHSEQVWATERRILNGDNTSNGALIKFTEPIASYGVGFKYISIDPLPWFSLDLSEMNNYDEIEQGEGMADLWLSYAYTGIELGTSIRGFSGSTYTKIGDKVYFIGNHKVFTPPYRSKYILDKSEYNMALFESNSDADIDAARIQRGWGTDFVTGVAHTNYRFNASFGAVGYNDLTFTQQNGYTVTVYDKLGNVIFDGTNQGNGVWRLTCTVDTTSYGRCPWYSSWWGYDGTNETWTVTKLS